MSAGEGGQSTCLMLREREERERGERVSMCVCERERECTCDGKRDKRDGAEYVFCARKRWGIYQMTLF